jgi:hypothetical protein
MTKQSIEIRVKGKIISVPSVCVAGRTVIAAGNWLKIASVMDEELVQGDTIADPESFAAALKESDLQADILTFAQKLPDSAPKYKFHMEWDNLAVVPITTYAEWLEKRAEYDVRKAVKRAKKLGVEVRQAEFNEAFVQGICGIYNDSPLRQGTAFWHYQKDFAAVQLENGTYLERSAFVGAYFEDELIGFIKMVYVNNIATTLQVISQKKHFDKKPTNALIAKAIEICEAKGVSHLAYGNYIYNDAKSSLTEFKRRNGFEKILLPRYYIPLTLKGKLALKSKLHHPPAALVPKSLLAQLRRARKFWHQRKAKVSSLPS